MAEQQQQNNMDLDQSQLCCSVCLDLLKEPVTIPCGHNYCKVCIEGCWEKEEQRGKYSCPQCREEFSQRPVLRRNNMLAEVVLKLKRMSTQQASPPAAVTCAGPSDVACDFCSEAEPNAATMSCLNCLASYCPTHLQPHYSVPVLKKHQLVSATVPLQEKMCTKHNKLMEVFCQTDKTCICYLCIIDEHKGHSTVSAAAETAEEQKQLTVSQKEVQQREQEREKELNQLIKALKEYKSCCGTAVKTNDDIFDELITSIKKKRTLVKQLMKNQEKTAVAKAEELQLQLEDEISKLRRRDSELEQLSHVDDNIHFIQTFKSLSISCENPDLRVGPFACPERSFRAVTDVVSQLMGDIDRLLNEKWPRISRTVSFTDFVMPPEPETREDMLGYCCPLTLDQNTVSKYLTISQENRRATSEKNPNCYLDRRLHRWINVGNNIRQVLCSESLSGRCYWEVTWSGSTWSVAVSYKDISQQSTYDSEFGNDNKSWSLDCSQKGYCFRHNRGSTSVSGNRTSTVGVYLDYEAGTLSFYSISGTNMTLLHKVKTTFTEPLYPGLGVKDDGSQSSSGSYAELIKLW
ncbi:tripartite motif-containing protein 16-like [Acanthopagrus latus]|uniref:tripartite motif-containing protein 16-like n=1 Tax=Acanthopagrus latus TaxID=8177 RepID=UPI00187CAC74|nr:tripartite motif-containing protein 16-like [Acanthopagrus latus]